MSLWVKIFTWLSPKPMTAAECRPVEAPLADWKDLQARVFRNVPELAHTAAIADERRSNPQYHGPQVLTHSSNEVNPEKISKIGGKIAETRQVPRRATKKPQKRLRVSRETSTAKRRKRSK